MRIRFSLPSAIIPGPRSHGSARAVTAAADVALQPRESWLNLLMQRPESEDARTTERGIESRTVLPNWAHGKSGF